jgi:hypothetical protein
MMVNRGSPLLQKRLAECDRARRYCRMCSEAIGSPANAHWERQCLQHQQQQSRYSERICRTLPAQVMSNNDSMNIDDLPAHPLLPPADTLRRRYTRESATLLRAEGSRGDISTGPPKPLRARSLSDKVLTYKGRPTLSGTISEVTA